MTTFLFPAATTTTGEVMSTQPYAPVVVASPSCPKVVLPGLGAGLLAAIAGVVCLTVRPAWGCLALLSMLVAFSYSADPRTWLKRGLVALGAAVAIYVVCALAVACVVLIALSSGSFG